MAAGGRKHRKQGAETPETQWAKGAETPETGGGNSGNGVKHPLVLLLVLLRAHLEAGLGLSLGLLGGGFLAAGLQWAVLGQRTLRGLRKRVRPFIAEGGNTGNRGWKRRKRGTARQKKEEAVKGVSQLHHMMGRKQRIQGAGKAEKQGTETGETGRTYWRRFIVVVVINRRIVFKVGVVVVVVRTAEVRFSRRTRQRSIVCSGLVPHVSRVER